MSITENNNNVATIQWVIVSKEKDAWGRSNFYSSNGFGSRICAYLSNAKFWLDSEPAREFLTKNLSTDEWEIKAVQIRYEMLED